MVEPEALMVVAVVETVPRFLLPRLLEAYSLSPGLDGGVERSLPDSADVFFLVIDCREDWRADIRLAGDKAFAMRAVSCATREVLMVVLITVSTSPSGQVQVLYCT